MAEDQNEYRDIEFTIYADDLAWALNNDALHGIAYALKAPIWDEPTSDDLEDSRRRLLIRVKRDDLDNAMDKLESLAGDLPQSDPTQVHAHGVVSALYREGLRERAGLDTLDDEDDH